ncbi:MAG: sulfatase-like hydrolase/transferase [Bacteroidales bacterium]|nr:sulfatase-like hydrolase/transferase [Bacteroidales bacterium]
MKKEINEYLLIPYRFAILLLLYAVERVSFYLFNTDLFSNTELATWPLLLQGGLKFDICALIYLNALWMVAYILCFRTKVKSVVSKWLNGIFYAFNIIGLGSNVIDFIYYRFILKRTTYNVLDILAGEENMGKLWWRFLFDYWYALLYFIVLIFLFVFLTRILKPRLTPIRNNWLYGGLGVVVLAVVAVLSVGGIRGDFKHSTRPITISNAAAYTASPEESAIVLNTPFSFIRTIGKKGFEHYSYFEEAELESIYTPVHLADTSAVLNKKNVVIFILESFSREFVGSMNKERIGADYNGYTPFLDSLISVGVAYHNAYSNGRKSIDAMPSVLASIPSLTLPYVVSQYSNNKINSVASILKEYGYQTAFFHGAPNGSMGFNSFAKMSGFDAYLGKDEYNNDADFDGWWGIWDHKFFPFYAQEISKMQEPFCTALFSLSSHHPFQVPKEFEGRFPQGPLPVEQCIGYSDNALRTFFNMAKNEPWYNNTLFVLTADHSSIPDHPEYKNNAEAFAIPIIFFAPGDPDFEHLDDYSIAQQADITPTILSYLGVNKSFLSFGKDLRTTPKEDRFAINFKDGVYQYFNNDTLAYYDGKIITGLFDLRNDPMLEKNLVDESLATKENMTKRVRAYLQQYNNRMIEDRLTVQ